MRSACRLVTAAVTLALACFPVAVLAWGAEGHRIIAGLAYERLTPKARATVAALLTHAPEQDTPGCPASSLEEAATWPDCVRSLRPRFAYLAPDHFEDVPICGVVAKAVYCPEGRCVSAETRRALVILRDASQRPAERLQALEEVAHFVGDIHQPLHAANNGDRGGNEIRVEVGGRDTNLHHLWDDEMVEHAVGRSAPTAMAMLRPMVVANATRWSAGDIDSWLAEAHRIAVAYVYAKLEHPPACGRPAPAQNISQDYLGAAAPIVRVQLARAAVRLAKVLNAVLS